MLKRSIIAPVVAAFTMFGASIASAATVKDVDLLFIIDQSGSMGSEFSTLAANIESFVGLLEADSRVGSVAGGLITFETSPTLVQSITTDIADLKADIDAAPIFGGTENGLGAISVALPGGALFDSVGWRNNTVKSLVFITDENADDVGLLTYAGVGQAVLNAGYLNNIIVSSGGSAYTPTAVPAGAVFDLNQFTADPAGFFTQFAAAKLGEIAITDPTGTIPVPASIPLLASGLALFGVVRRRRHSA